MTHPFTPEYIRMCKAAEEIQARKMRSEGDFIWSRGEDHQIHLVSNSFNVLSYCTWIPRLDQLMGMLGPPIRFFEIAAEWNPARGPARLREVEDQDWHEMTLTIVMREKHGKSWDTKEGKWVK